MHISFLDIAIMVLYLVFTLFIGYYVSKKVNGFEDFALGGRSFGPFALAATFGVWLESRGLCTIQVSLLCGLH